MGGRLDSVEESSVIVTEDLDKTFAALDKFVIELEEVVGAIDENNEYQQDLLHKVTSLTEQAKNINDVLEIISDIADEVRKLAERTQKSLSEISANVNLITQNVVEISDETRKTSDNMAHISASLSAMLITAFVNYEIDKNTAISLDALVEEALRYIKTVLIHDEILSIEFVFIDGEFETLRYAKFSMPATLMMHRDGTITELKSNNPPVSRFTKRFEIDEIPVADAVKILLTSDGITENMTINEGKLYAQYLCADFAEALSKYDLYGRFEERIATQEEDATFILLHKIEYASLTRTSRTFCPVLMSWTTSTNGSHATFRNLAPIRS